MNLFQISANDQSVYYLGRIFGNVGNVLAGTGPALMGEMFKTFNSILLAFAALIIAYSTVVGLINTATQGDFLGKHWNKFWTPIRIVVGIIGLVPLPGSGYCLVQVVLMWFIMQGIGAADAVWSTTVDYLLKGGAVQTPPPGNFGGLNSGDVQQIYKGLVCQASVKKYYCAKKPDDPWCKSDLSNIVIPAKPEDFQGYKMGPIGPSGPACGMVDVDRNKNVIIQLAQIQSLAIIIPTLKQVADFEVETVDIYTRYKQGEKGIEKPSWLPEVTLLPDPMCPSSGCSKELGKLYGEYALLSHTGSNFIRDVTNLYTGYILNAATKSSRARDVEDVALSRGKDEELRAALEKSKVNGWVFAGGYYYLIASLNNEKIDGAGARLQVDGVGSPSKDKGGNPWFNNVGSEELPKIVNQYASGEASINYIVGEQAKGGGEGTFGGGVGAVSNLFGNLGGLSQEIVKGWMKTLTSNPTDAAATNPIIELQSFGRWLLFVIQAMFVVLVVTSLVSVGLANTCAAINGMGYGVNKAVSFAAIPIFFFMGAMFTFAATLSVYIPLIPYILFTFGVIGWLILTIEAMIAGPIIAIGIMLPEGGHEVWGHASPAGRILMSIVLRPTLMIFGMMAGMLLSYVVVVFINAAFLGVMKQVGAPGLVEVFLFMAIYTGLLISALNKCFALIHQVPDKVLRFIGGHGEQLGEGEMESKASKAFGESSGEAKGAGDAAAKRGGQATETRKKAKEEAGGPTIKGSSGGGEGGNPPSASA